MGMFDEEVEVKPIKEVKEPVSCDFDKLNKEIKESEKMTNERVLRASEALKDSAEAYKLANVPAQSEDIRALAITFMIDEGKTGRMDRFDKKPEARAEAPAPIRVEQPVSVPTNTQTVKCGLCGAVAYPNENKASEKSPDFKCPACKAVNWANRPAKWLPPKAR